MSDIFSYFNCNDMHHNNLQDFNVHMFLPFFWQQNCNLCAEVLLFHLNECVWNGENWISIVMLSPEKMGVVGCCDGAG